MIRLIIDKIRKILNTVEYWRRRGASIGEDCEIYSTADFGSEPYLINIGEHVRINSGVQFITHDGGVWVCRKYIKEKDSFKIDLFKPIKIGNNVHIGTNAIIMPGVHIGDNCIIGCGAVVTRNIPDCSIAVGVPARVIESLDDYIIKNKCHFVFTKHMSKEEKKALLKAKF